MTIILASGPAPDAVREAARKVLEDGGYQTEIPEPVEQEIPDWIRRLIEWLASLVSGVGGGAILEVFFWTIMAVAVFFLLRWLFSEWHRRRGTAAAEGGDFDQVPVPDLGPLPDPEALAREGEFAAAVHALLLHAYRLLVTKLRFDLRAAFTSREVLSRVNLGGAAGAELQGLVLAVEISRFGGADVGVDDFDRCRARYARFVDAIDRGKA